MRTSPNIIITGTPGVGKTVHSEQVAQDTGLRNFPINKIAKERDCHDGYDDERQSWIIDEDKVGGGHPPALPKSTISGQFVNLVSSC
jgi:broad-specificity NMP kinase